MALAFIPVRCGSKGIPKKNIKLFCGQPLVFWCLKALSKVKDINKIIVATDCDEIENTVEGFQFNTVSVFRRSKKNASDESTTESVILEYLEQAPQPGHLPFMLVQATSPFTSTSDFENGLHMYQQNSFDSILSVVENHVFLWDGNGKSINYDYKNRNRRQNLNKQYAENGAFYINSVNNILSNKNRLSGKIGYYVMPKYSSIELDDAEDWFIAEKIAAGMAQFIN